MSDDIHGNVAQVALGADVDGFNLGARGGSGISLGKRRDEDAA